MSNPHRADEIKISTLFSKQSNDLPYSVHQEQNQSTFSYFLYTNDAKTRLYDIGNATRDM